MSKNSEKHSFLKNIKRDGRRNSKHEKVCIKTCFVRVKKIKPISFTFVVKLLITHINIP